MLMILGDCRSFNMQVFASEFMKKNRLLVRDQEWMNAKSSFVHRLITITFKRIFKVNNNVIFVVRVRGFKFAY